MHTRCQVPQLGAWCCAAPHASCSEHSSRMIWFRSYAYDHDLNRMHLQLNETMRSIRVVVRQQCRQGLNINISSKGVLLASQEVCLAALSHTCKMFGRRSEQGQDLAFSACILHHLRIGMVKASSSTCI